MRKLHVFSSPMHNLSKSLLAVLVACLLLAFSTTAAFAAEFIPQAGSVHVYDNVGVLSSSQVYDKANSLPSSVDVDIYSINYSGSNSSFVTLAKQSIKTTHMIVLAFNSHYMTVVGGSNVSLSNSQYTDAANAFVNNYHSSHNYTNAVLAALDSLHSNLSGSGFGSALLGIFCVVILVLLVGVVLFAFMRRRRSGFVGQQQQPIYNQPFNQGGYPPNYAPNYPPNQGGMNPWAAGGLGAAGGGLIGYELGKEAGERAEREREGNYGGGGGFGGGGFGGGAGADYGGGNDGGGFGGGNDGGGFGGGGFGGGNDGGGFGGGGGGDFGGGGNDNSGGGGGGSF